MFVHKGSQINNVQLITGLRIAEMSQLQNCSVMCTKNGSYCENEKKREKVRWEVGMCTKNGSYCEKKNQSRTNGPINPHLTIAQVMPRYNPNNEKQEALL